MMQYSLGDIVTTKKKHPCGSFEWSIIRTGADYKLKCLNCGRVVMLPYSDFLKIVKKVRTPDE